MDEHVRRKLARYTVAPAGAPEGADDDVFVALPGDDLVETFARARTALDAERRVRVVGHGVTLRGTWPDWVPSADGLRLTELGAYRAESSLEGTADLRSGYRAWIDRVFAPATATGGAGEIFYTSVILRLFQDVLDAHLLVANIPRAHPSARIHVDGVATRSSLRDRAKAALVVPAIVAGWTPGVAYALHTALRERVDARESFAALKHSRNDDVEVWVGLVPDWARINRHVVDAVALPVLAAKGRIGVCLIGTLRQYERDEHTMKRGARSTRLWSGLGALGDSLDKCSVAQAVMPSSTARFARSLARALTSSARVTARAVRWSRPLREAALRSGLVAAARQAVAASTMDVVRSVLAEEAAKEVIADHALRGRPVVFAASNAAGVSSAERLFREAGAITIEHTHGSGGAYFHGAAESSASLRLVWTHADEHALRGGSQAWVVAGMPPSVPRPRVSRREVHRILLVTNYVHRDWAVQGRFPAEPFLYELVRGAALLRERFPDLELRWRPHPSDDHAAVARAHAKMPFVELSVGRDLALDLDWCDAMVGSQSTALIQAVRARVPLFVQATPEYRAALAWVMPEREFFTAEELVDRFSRWRSDAANFEVADERARRELFGASGEPASFIRLLENQGVVPSRAFSPRSETSVRSRD